jgi:hypothetical protein
LLGYFTATSSESSSESLHFKKSINPRDTSSGKFSYLIHPRHRQLDYRDRRHRLFSSSLHRHTTTATHSTTPSTLHGFSLYPATVIMAAFPMHNFYRPSPLTIDPNAKFFEEDDSSILDDNILDHSGLDSGLEMSPPMEGNRRDSFNHHNMFSPKNEEWQHVDMQTQPSSNPFVDSSNSNPFMRLDSAQAPNYAQSQWSLAHGSGSCTPMQSYDGLPADFDGSASLSYRPMQGQTPFSNPNAPVLFSSTTSNPSMPGSPQKDFVPSNSLEYRAMPKRMRPHSPVLRSHSPLLRRDGIRKKNARFDIPAEHNLNNIDQLIATSTDEQEIKELKQQKRLLRNRQAAYGSPGSGCSPILVKCPC